MFAVTAIPSLLFLLASLLVPESPRWLAFKGRHEDASRVLERLGGRSYAQHVMEDFAEVTAAQPRRSMLAELRSPGLAPILLLGVFLAVLQQWCGINVIFNYAQEIFAAAGYQVSDILFNIVVTGAVNVAFTFVAFVTIDHFGRRFLLLTGLGGLIVIYGALGLLYHMHLQGKPMLVLVLAAIACYAMSLAPATWVVISEIFPTAYAVAQCRSASPRSGRRAFCSPTRSHCSTPRWDRQEHSGPMAQSAWRAPCFSPCACLRPREDLSKRSRLIFARSYAGEERCG